MVGPAAILTGFVVPIDEALHFFRLASPSFIHGSPLPRITILLSSKMNDHHYQHDAAADHGNDATTTAIHPGSPTSLGALLAEENAMRHPNPVLPSFLERMFMDEANRAGQQAVTLSMNLLHQYVGTRLHHLQQQMENSNTHQHRRWYFWKLLLQKCYLRILQFFHKLLSKYGREIRVLLMYWLERQCLLTNQASLSESVYGGRRVQLGSTERTNHNNTETKRSLVPADRRNLIRLALWLSLGPYLSERWAIYLKHCQQELASLQYEDDSSKYWSRLWKQCFVRIYPFGSSTLQIFWIWYQWQYLVGRSVYFDPVSHLLQLVVTMQQQPQSEMPAQHRPSGKASNPTSILAVPTNQTQINPNSTATTTTAATTWIPTIITGVLSSTLFIGWLAQWRSEWNQYQQQQQQQLQHRNRHSRIRSQNSDRINNQNSDNNNNNNNQHLVHDTTTTATTTIAPFSAPFPPPPPPPSKTAVNRCHGTCPLCLQQHRHPTTWIQSGQVYCYRCLKRFLEDRPKATSNGEEKTQSTALEGMLRLYESCHASATNPRS